MSFLKGAFDGGMDNSQVNGVVGRIGNAMNRIATAGGAQPGYAAPPQMAQPQMPQQVGLPNNQLQLLDPNVLRMLIQRFGGRQGQI